MYHINFHIEITKKKLFNNINSDYYLNFYCSTYQEAIRSEPWILSTNNSSYAPTIAQAILEDYGPYLNHYRLAGTIMLFNNPSILPYAYMTQRA